MTRLDFNRRLRMLKNQFQAGDIDAWEYRMLRRGAVVAYAETQPQRKRARRRVQSAVDSGVMQKPDLCELCGAGGPLEGHHNGYLEALAVRFLCPICHALADGALSGARRRGCTSLTARWWIDRALLGQRRNSTLSEVTK